MSEFTRIISIATLFFLSFFCFQVGIFLWSGHKLKQNGRRTLILIEFFTGFLLLFDALAYFYRGNTSEVGYHMVRIANFFVFICNSSVSFFFDINNVYHRSTFYPLSIVLGLLPGLITLTMFLQNRKKLATNVFVSLLFYFILPFVGIVLILFFYSFPWINISLGLGALHLFYSSIKLMELEFYSGKQAASIDPGPWNGTFTLLDGTLNVIKPHIWGDTVNVASRMESTGVSMKIHVTETTKAQTSNLFQYSENTEIDVKGKGMMKTFFL